MILLSISLVLGVIAVLVEFDASLFGEGDEFLWWVLGLSFVTYIFLGALIYLIYRRRNWARIVLLLFFLAGAAITLYPWPGTDDYWTMPVAVSQLGLLLLDGVALALLFTGAGAAWFARKQEGAF